MNLYRAFTLFLLSSFSVCSAKAPNVLLISIDDLNDWVGILGGHPQSLTPNIDRLAKRGTLFTNAHCQSPVCNPSRASMMTGRYPHSTGIYFLSPQLKQVPAMKDVLTMPQYFAKQGYRTMAAGKIFHTSDKLYFEEYKSTGGFGPIPEKKISQPHGHPLWDWGAYPDTDGEMPDMVAAQWAAKKLSQTYDKPFFMGVGFYRPHVPMFAPKKWFDMHPRSKIQLPLVKANDRDDLSPYAVSLTNDMHVSPEHEWLVSAGEWDHAVQAYLASVTFADHCLGIVLDALDASPHADNTIVVLFSDHGFHLGEKSRWAKRSLWEDGTRVPLIITAPDLKKNQQCTRPAELIDVFPTLLDLAKLDADPSQEGQSLLPLLKKPKASWNNPAITSFGAGNYAIRSERYRYIRYLDGSEEFYDHETDPHEWTNLAQQPKFKTLLLEHARHLPKKEHTILSGKSTGHDAYKAAGKHLSLE